MTAATTETARAVVPLTATQEEILLLDALSPPGRYVMTTHFPLPPDADDGLVVATLEALVARHDALRLLLERGEGRNFQRLVEPYPVTLGRRAPGDDRLPEVDPTQRPGLVWERVDGDDGPRVQFAGHHVFLDGWSVALLARDFYATYRSLREGRGPGDTAAGSFLDYARRQHDELAAGGSERYLRFWRGELGGATPFALPQDARDDLDEEALNRYIAFTLTAEEAAALGQVAADAQVTVSAVYLAVLGAVLRAESGAPDLTLLSFVADRVRRRNRDLVGFLLNPVALHLRPDPAQAVPDAARHAFATFVRAMRHQVGPFQELTADPALAGAISPMVTYQFHGYMPGPDEDLTAGTGAPPRADWPEEGNLHSLSDLDVELFPVTGGRVTCRTMYRPTLWSHHQMAALVEHYHEALRRVVRRPSLALGAL
jgi:hypothetical protein